VRIDQNHLPVTRQRKNYFRGHAQRCPTAQFCKIAGTSLGALLRGRQRDLTVVEPLKAISR
jgi:hypothetical protein